MFNALLKIPMQFFILFTGVMVFVFFLFQPHNILFNRAAVSQIKASDKSFTYDSLNTAYNQALSVQRTAALDLSDAMNQKSSTAVAQRQLQLQNAHAKASKLRDRAKKLEGEVLPTQRTEDSDYVFLTFIMTYLPKGVIGLLLAVILAAAMSSTSGELNALGSTATVDLYKRIIKQNASEKHYVKVSKWLTAFWGVFAICFALFANFVENLIEAVNILGSLFYGTILGIFLVAFFLKKIGGTAVFYAAVLAEITVLLLFFFEQKNLAYLWLNLVGCGATLIYAVIFSLFVKKPRQETGL